jgi:hypothetical protein
MDMIIMMVLFEIANVIYEKDFKDNITSSNNIMVLTKQEAYDKYQNADTDGTLIGLHDTRALHDNFVSAIENYTPPSSAPVVSKQDFLENLLTRTFHLYWAANLTPPGYGVGNPALFTMRRNNTSGDYDLSYVSLTDVTQTQSFDPSYYILHSNSIMLQDTDANGNVKRMIVKRTPHTTVNGTQIWNHQFMIGDRLLYNYYMVDFRL